MHLFDAHTITACQARLLHEVPMTRRNDAYTAIYFYRYL